MKRITSIICLALLCVMLFTGCTGSVRPTASPVVSPSVTNTPDITNTPEVSPAETDHIGENPVGGDDGTLPNESPIIGDEASPNP